jgi:hypothetical protein
VATQVATCTEVATRGGGFRLTYDAGTGEVDYASVTGWEVRAVKWKFKDP